MTGIGTVSIAICTHNRADHVAKCLAALMPQIGKTPVVLVDSGSTVADAHAVKSLARDHGIEHIRLDEPGLSLARNVAADWATGDWVVYLDDDAIPADNWFEALEHALAAVTSDVGILGGRIVPGWPEDIDHRHVTARWKDLLSCTERDGRGDVQDGYNVCGANLAVRKSALDRIGGFPTSLGRFGGKLLSGEESYVIDALFKLGIRSCYDSAFEVEHSISKERLSVAWVRDRAYWDGISRVKIFQALGEPIPKNMSVSKLIASLLFFNLRNVVKHDADSLIRAEKARGSLRALLNI